MQRHALSVLMLVWAARPDCMPSSNSRSSVMAYLCACDSSFNDARKEIKRLRTNWVFIWMICTLTGISYTSVVSSFHQFITNPTAASLINQSDSDVEPGLGQSEVFYSWALTVFNIGALVGGLITGVVLKFIPYWYVILFGLLSHTLGYLVYAVTTVGWLIMLSKFFSGLYISLAMALALTYYAETSVDYQAAHKALGNDEVKAGAVKNRLFAIYQLGIAVGYTVGPGAALLFSLFDISQFRSIAWFNVAGGAALLVLQVVLFHGESNCKKLSKMSWKSQKCPKKLPRLHINCLNFFLLVFLMCCDFAMSSKLGTYETIFNPVLSDYFGFTERQNTYVFLGFNAPRIVGIITLIVLQHLKVNNRILLIIALVSTIAGAALMADWQSIPNDPCTDLSPFHHPELAANYSNTNVSLGAIHSDDTRADIMDSTGYVNAHTQKLQVLPEDVYTIAMNKCESAAIPNHHCYWTPNSIMTKLRCDDCQPICRSTKRSLNFEQFIFGASVFVGSMPFGRVPIVALVSERVTASTQGIALGMVITVQMIARSTSPVWLDAAYEVLQKRTVLAMGLLIVTYLPFLVCTVALYQPLGKPPPHKTDSPGNEKPSSGYLSGDNDSGNDESKQLVPK